MQETRFAPEFIAQYETIFSLSNGYIGLRGEPDEGAPAQHPGVLINGFYETWPIPYGEAAYGFARTGQTVVNVTDAKTVRLYVDDEPFELEKANILSFQRTVDWRRGVMEREIRWETPAGKRIAMRSLRMVSFVHRHLALVDVEVSCENQTAHFVLSSEMATRHLHGDGDGTDPRRAGGFDGRVLEQVDNRAAGRRVILCHRTRHSGMHVACAMDHELATEGSVQESTRTREDFSEVDFSVDVQPGQPVRLTKFIAYHTSDGSDMNELLSRGEQTLDRAAAIGFDRLLEEQREHLDAFWDCADVVLEDVPAAQQVVRFSLWQLHQATARAEGLGIPAKGLTGQGYEGHYFWDGEIYVLPFVTYTQPRIARNFLHFRYGLLDKARARARELSHPGALYPWRTINGEEASAYYAAGTAQYHINADIMHALRQYSLATDDVDFICREGAEMLVETARFWLDLGHFSERRDGAFCIEAVTGPDEYSAVVDNNRYTNMMARENLLSAARTVRHLADIRPDDYRSLAERLDLDLSESERWQEAANRMYLPVDPETGIHPQDDTFLDRERWDMAHTPPEKYPLLLHFHPLTIYRHQVLKQADVVMAMFLLGHFFDRDEKRRNFDYYDPLTTRDSSLSSCIQSIVASELGYGRKALEYFLDAALVDLADIGGNVVDGVHVASAGGVWMALVNGFGGFRDHDGRFTFRPRLPEELSGLRYSLCIRGQRLRVHHRQERTRYELEGERALEIEHEGKPVRLSPEDPVCEIANGA
jgi:alpha,alpha-trehalose phosphorylase